jgi:Asp-tRNA(Asn)/Glu-tRNA(Gln) amidotransferase A subunit family amidase
MRSPLLSYLCAATLIAGSALRAQPMEDVAITPAAVDSAATLIGLVFTAAERDSMLEGLSGQRSDYALIRSVSLPNSLAPALLFDPRPSGFLAPLVLGGIIQSPALELPTDSNGLAFATVGQLGELIRSRRISSAKLTAFYLRRLKQFGPRLECTVTLTEELAMEQARQADEELSRGIYRGPLHGIPYGLKDLFATRGIRTTWGSVPFQDQMIDEDAAVVRRLREAGAVLLAKLSVGELAWGDVWFGGKTRNPWNLDQGSSGSSAGSAATTAAGLVAFAIGTETWGSIVSPSTRCGTTGLRPTFGRVSRQGAMTLSWTMDKVGPICRCVEDCALVFAAISGADPGDPSTVDYPFSYAPRPSLEGIRIGYLTDDIDSSDNREHDRATLEVLEALGARLVPIRLPSMPIEPLSVILSAEAAAAFDELTRSGQDDLMVRQVKNAWPNVFRIARFIPAVEYLQAMRIRRLLIEEMQALMSTVDVYVAPSLSGDNLLLTNLTGHPCVVIPNGFTEEGTPTSISFIGQLYDEGRLLAVAKACQDATDYHRRRPPFALEQP